MSIEKIQNSNHNQLFGNQKEKKAFNIIPFRPISKEKLQQ